jgi:hypothetical protein
MRVVEMTKYKASDMITLQANPVEGGIKGHVDSAGWAKLCEESGPAYTGRHKDTGEIIGCGGVIIYWPGVGEGWSIFSKDTAFQYKREIFVYTRKFFDIVIANYNLWRIQATLRVDMTNKPPRAPGGKPGNWLEHLDFEYEGTLKKYCPDGTDSYMYSRIIEQEIR